MMFGASSCGEDFLNLQPQQSVADANFLKNVDDFRTAILGAHDQLQNSDWYGRYFLLVPDVMGEDIKQNASANRAKEWAEYNGTSVDFIPNEFWAELYEGINIANQIINAEYTAPTPEVQAEVDHIKGQARAIRGLAHFDLVRLFAQHYTFTAGGGHVGVPIVTEYNVAAKPARNTVAEVYTQVIDDLTAGYNGMTLDPPNAGYMNKIAAAALLGRVYLYMDDFSNAEAWSTTAITEATAAGKSLVANADYPTMFLDGNSSEALFEINMILVDNNGSDHLGGMYKESGYGDYLPSNILFTLLDTLNTDDIRGKGAMWLADPNLTGIFGSVRVNKYPSAGSTIATDNLPIIRLSEVYLNRAEARAKLGTNDAGARDDANMLINLRTNGFNALTTESGQALVDAILDERRRELYAEGHRIFDISRNQLDMDRQDAADPANCTSITCFEAYPNDRFILPIPLDELSANPQIENDQNPGY